MEADPRKKRNQLALRWVARFWSLPALWFMTAEILFPHADAANEENVWMLVSLAIMFISVFSLALAWFFEKVGGWLSLGSLLLFLSIYWITTGEFFPAFWMFLLFVAAPAGLFLLHAYQDSLLHNQNVVEA